MNILVVNDDGIRAKGIQILAKALLPYGDIFVVAPQTEQSGAAHAITLHEPMGLKKHEDFMAGVSAWSLEGKPADCVKFAAFALELKPDLVVSGINDGANLGTDIMYSGTVSGAFEGVILGIPSIAISTDFNHFDIVEREIDALIGEVMGADILDRDVVLNINFPSAIHTASKGIRITHQGQRPFDHAYEFDGEKYWAKGTWYPYINDESTDVYAFENGYVSITPLKTDRTDYDYLNQMKAKFNR